MADNVTLDPGSGGATIRTDDDGTAQWQYVKLAYGADNTQTIVGSISSNPLPVALSSTDNAVLDTIDAVLDTINAKLVTGTVIGDVNLGATDNAVLDSIQTAVEIIDNPVLVDDAAFTPGSTSVMMVGFEYDDTTPDVVNEGDAGAARMSTRREIYTQIRDAAGNERGANIDASNRLTVLADLGATDNAVLDSIDAAVNGTLTVAAHDVTNAGTFAVQISDTSFAVADGNALGEGVLVQGDDGTDRKNINVDATTGDVQVDVTNTVTVSAHDVTNAGTFVVQEDGAALTALQIIDNPVFADDAAFTLASSSVSMAGAIRDDALTTLAAIEGDAVPLRVSSTGALHVTGGGGGTQYNVDDPGPTVVTMAGAVRDDALTTLTEADGDATLLRVSSTGALHVTGGGGGTEYTQDDAHTDPATAATWLMARDDALATQESLDGDWTIPRANARGAQWVELDLTNPVTVTATNLDVQSGGVDLATSAQGSAIQTAVELLDNALYVDDADWTDSSSSHLLVGGLYQSTPQTVTDGDVAPFNITANGALHTAVQNTVTVTATNLDVQSGGTDLATSAQGSAIQTAVEIMDDWDETNRCAVNTISGQVGVAGNTGVVGATTQRVTLATDVALPAGTNAIGKLAANSGVDIGDVDVLSIAAGTNEIGGFFQNASLNAVGTTTYYDMDLDETKVAVDAGAVRIYSIHAMNTTAAPLYLQMFNVASGSVTVGTTTPTNQYIIPGNADSDGAGFTMTFNPPKSYGTAFTIACTTDNEGSGAPGANACHVNIEYAT